MKCKYRYYIIPAIFEYLYLSNNFTIPYYSGMNLHSIINPIYDLPESSLDLFTQQVTEIHLPKGHVLLHADKIENSIYLLKKGIVRAYADTEDREVTFWFGTEGDPVISMKSYVSNEKGYENIELLEDCELYCLESKNLKDLYTTDIHIANWGRTFIEKELVKAEERLISLQFKTASVRYRDLLINYPHLLQRVPLGHIASYLGITQASLSRIRAEII